MKVSDFFCSDCNALFQVKAKDGRFGSSVSNSAYESKMEAIRLGKVPNYVFLSYDSSAWTVTGGFVVPGYFMTPSVIAKRAPLAATARRAGWVGSNILLGAMPPDARVPLIVHGAPRTTTEVRADWSRFRFLQNRPAESRGWIADVLATIRALGQPEFHLSELYSKAAQLQRLHPKNQHVDEKIRQQVFVLRDKGVLRPLGNGRYRIVHSPASP